jgi:flagellar hook-basal body complex protein FliE
MSNALPNMSAASILQAYQNAGAGTPASGITSGISSGIDVTGGGEAFSNLLGRAMEGAISSGKQADAQAAQAISGHGDLTQVVTAVSQAELALQTSVAVRDRVLQAYQDIIKMPI